MSSLAVARTTIIKGPGVVTLGSNDYVTEGDITVNTQIQTFPIKTSIHGSVDERVMDVISTVTFTPIGTLANITGLFPFQPSGLGQSIFGVSDTAVQVRSLVANQGGIYLKGAAVTKSPSITFSPAKVLLGSCTITAIGSSADNMQRTGTGAGLPTGIPTGSYSSSHILTVPYTGSGAGFTNVETVDGFTFDVNASFQNISVDSVGVIDMLMTELDATIKFRPANMTDAQILAVLAGTGVDDLRRGSSLGDNGSTFTITPKIGTGIQCSLTRAAAKSGGGMYGLGQIRGGAVELVGNVSVVAGVPQNLYTLTQVTGS